MFILEVIPLVKIPLPFSQILTYFSREPLKKGVLIRVPVGKRKAAALVKNCFSVEEKKMEVKKGPFALKSVQGIISKSRVITEHQFQLGVWMGRHYLASLGSVFKSFLPQGFEKRKRRIKKEPLLSPAPAVWRKGAKTRPVLLWQKERQQFYRKEIERVLGQKKQVLFLVPEVQFLEKIEKQIKEFASQEKVVVFRGDLKAREKRKIWQKAAQAGEKIILGTRSALFLPFQGLGLIIVDREENQNYDVWGKEPRYSAKEAALKLAEITGAKIIFGTELPSVESYYRFCLQEDLSRVSRGATSERAQQFGGAASEIEIVDMREERRKGNFSIFSDKLTELLKKGDQTPLGQAILFINRRGLSTALSCQECGTVIKCKNCDVPLVYHLTTTRDPFLLCHHCGLKEAPPDTCPNCRSWRLKQAGKGSQKVFAELKKMLPKINIARLDSDIAPTPKEQKKIIDDFVNKKTDILVATQLLLKFQVPSSPPASASSALEWPAGKLQSSGLVAVVLVDPLLNLPEFRSRERVFQLLNKLRVFGKKMIIQTYNPGLSIFQYLKENKAEEFFAEELKQRKSFSYPPFSEIIRLTFSHKDPKKAQKEAQVVKEKISKSLSSTFPDVACREVLDIRRRENKFQVLGPAPGFIPKIRDKYVWQIIVKIKNQKGPYGQSSTTKTKIKKMLLEIISPQWKIEVNPESLL